MCHYTGLMTNWRAILQLSTCHIRPYSMWPRIVKNRELVGSMESMTPKLAVFNAWGCKSRDKSMIVVTIHLVFKPSHHLWPCLQITSRTQMSCQAYILKLVYMMGTQTWKLLLKFIIYIYILSCALLDE